MRKMIANQLPSKQHMIKLMTAKMWWSLGSTSTTVGCEADGWFTTTTFCIIVAHHNIIHCTQVSIIMYIANDKTPCNMVAIAIYMYIV